MRQNKTVAVWTNLVFLSHRNSPKALLKMSMLSLDFSEHLRADADFASEVVGPVDILQRDLVQSRYTRIESKCRFLQNVGP